MHFFFLSFEFPISLLSFQRAYNNNIGVHSKRTGLWETSLDGIHLVNLAIQIPRQD